MSTVSRPAILSACAIALFGIAAIAIGEFRYSRPAQPHAPVLLQPQPALYGELVDCKFGGVAMLNTALKTAFARWDAVGKSISITRNERQNVTSEWHRQIQELSASFYVVEVRPLCDQKLYVLGLYETGESTIEEWVFEYPSSTSDVG